ncbi:hypothetical protein Verru16b_02111 [Lacunisphaera limnophila]|uniref:Uncharacterized protein n=2 Tax=Lacunisphaera limnophila TaxID=1838286 RepID=A0A1D8AVX4_9BACT|nr:hypothetical protein Verru16b_02111 [Lacunisphaera limnophila]
MDETLLELENELKRLTPRRPSALFRAALEEAMSAPTPVLAPRNDPTATTVRPWKWVAWSLAGVAAAVAFLFTLPVVRDEPTPALEPVPASGLAVAGPEELAQPVAMVANRYAPVQATSVLYDLHEGDPTTLPDRTEGREVRYRYVDTYTWKNPATNASLRWSVPRDEVRLIRANLD